MGAGSWEPHSQPEAGTGQAEGTERGEELEGEGGVEESSVECDGCGPVEVLEAAGLLEAGPLEAELKPPVVSAVDLIGHCGEEVRGSAGRPMGLRLCGVESASVGLARRAEKRLFN